MTKTFLASSHKEVIKGRWKSQIHDYKSIRTLPVESCERPDGVVTRKRLFISRDKKDAWKIDRVSLKINC